MVMQNPEDAERGTAPQPSPDRLTAADRDRYRAEYEAAAANALLALNAPWWRRVLALLPNPQRPLADWIAANKIRMRDRL